MTEIEEKIVQHDEQIKGLYKTVKKLEVLTSDLNRLSLSVERIAINQSTMIEQQKQLQQDVETLKLEPAKKYTTVKNAVMTSAISTIVGALVGAILTLLLK